MTATIAAPESPTHALPRTPPWLAVVAGVVACAVALTGSGGATLNGDELATLSAARRGISGMWELAQHIDGHFLPYYVFMHFWTAFGEAELWLRLPSAVAIGVAAAFLVCLGRRLHGTTAGLTAAALFAVLPSVSYYGAFARSYAFAAAAVTISFWCLHRARWVRYAMSVAFVGCTHLFAVLVLPAHLALLRRSTASATSAGGTASAKSVGVTASARGPWGMVLAMAAGFVPAAVLGLIGYGERHAISWIPQRGPEVLLKFPKMAAGASGIGLLLFAVALAGAVLMIRRDTRWGLALSGWLLLPPVLLLAVSHLVTPVYVDRYLFVTAPALALLAAIAVAELPRFAVPAAVALTVAAGALAVPQHGEIREPNGRFEDVPWAIRRMKLEPGDAIVYGQSSLRTGFDYYAAAVMPDDVLREGTAPAADSFAYPEKVDVAAALAGRDRVWLVWRGAKDADLPAIEKVRQAGFDRAQAWHSADIPGLTVSLYTRKAGLP
ncbi:glycosyltransferase family 39 protein [Nonomuraea sp. NPDC003804]|uniref:glycosyltransferase family 39 protein n=1 Tax=Nonomuraea sp. NPDC003804 TaxID=3154547 RepID=UPI0033A33611